MSTPSSGRDDFYSNFDDTYLPMDIYTAANLGDVSYFMKCDISQLADQLSRPNRSGWTPLMYACSKGHSLLVNYLLMLGAERNCRSKSGVTPLMLAISSADLQTVENIFSFSSLEERDYRKWTAVFYAVHYSREKCLHYLLSKGANVNVLDYQNESPLMKAIKLGREAMVELILKSARNLDVVSYKQESAMMLANESSNTKIQTLVKSHYEFLKMCEKNVKPTDITPVRQDGKTLKSPLQQCIHSPLRQQFKLHISHLKMSRSLSYSPNKQSSPSPKAVPKTDLLPSKRSFARKFWMKPHNDVEKFLKSLDLEKYWPIFRDEEVDFETLLTFNEENLKELGIALFGPRRKIYLAIEQLRNYKSRFYEF